jgi:hypothetical protein
VGGDRGGPIGDSHRSTRSACGRTDCRRDGRERRADDSRRWLNLEAGRLLRRHLTAVVVARGQFEVLAVERPSGCSCSYVHRELHTVLRRAGRAARPRADPSGEQSVVLKSVFLHGFSPEGTVGNRASARSPQRPADPPAAACKRSAAAAHARQPSRCLRGFAGPSNSSAWLRPPTCRYCSSSAWPVRVRVTRAR